ncbi:hypothetical protein GCM10025867_44220 [Frondihabitans sucicola]|uniref:Uncharacterized protein n=1 Tax=Frondihabitans sucicola TaxID=1268041 RepID=A0ABM8GUR7_9MICO|nr:hypothetical protein [Frondihabitans sucicola]BDZ52181.1 hypothetical protein GCM10025867_44220 [Frondihabitans sucicola]
MATTLHRFTVTETAAVAHAIDLARFTWPELQNDRAALLRRIIEWSGGELEERRASVLASRREAIRANAGAATGAFPPDAADSLKGEWAE